MSDSLHVWGHGTARTLRVYWAMCELELDYATHPVRTRTIDMEDPLFLAVSPGKKIPALTHGKINLTESCAILEYLFRLAGKAPLDINVAAEIERWACFALSEIDATALYVLRRHEDLPEIYGEAPVACLAARDYFKRQISVVDSVLDDGRSFLVGNSLSKADIILGSCCFWSELYQLELPDSVCKWFEKLKATKNFKNALVKNAPPKNF